MRDRYYPLIYKFDDMVLGTGFVARVKTKGICLMAEDTISGEVWVDAVQPAGFSAGGPNQEAAALAFKKEYQALLQELASEANGHEEFDALMRSTMLQTCALTMSRWEEARELVRSGKITSDWLPQDTNDQKASVDVTTMSLSDVTTMSLPTETREKIQDLISQPQSPLLDGAIWSRESSGEMWLSVKAA